MPAKDEVEHPVVTIVVVAHSVRDELERCFASIAAHADVPVETILVDNASTDDTRRMGAPRHIRTSPIVELPENIGVAARDHGLRRARGRFTMFLDSDAALTQGALPAMVEALDDQPGLGPGRPAARLRRRQRCSSRAAVTPRCSCRSFAGRRWIGSSRTGAPSAIT